MTRFTEAQYADAVAHLADASMQLAPDGRGCVCCGGSWHQAFECGHNPLVAMATCVAIAECADKQHEELHGTDLELCTRETLVSLVESFHELLHQLSGACTYMGERTGPARVVLP